MGNGCLWAPTGLDPLEPKPDPPLGPDRTPEPELSE